MISDIAMPDEDGYSLVRRIRAIDATNQVSPVPVIAVSALARDGDRADALAAGFDAHIAKPFETEELVAAIERLTAEAKRR